MSKYRINLDLSPKIYKTGSVSLFLNWVDIDRGPEPAFVFRRALGGSAVFALPLRTIHGLVESTGFGVVSIIAQAAEIAVSLGFDRMDRFAAKDIADLILDHTDELVKMPPWPPGWVDGEDPNGPRAELSLKIDGQTVIQTEVAA